MSRKGKAATLRDVEVMAAARDHDLIDNKVVAFSAEPDGAPARDPGRPPPEGPEASTIRPWATSSSSSSSSLIVVLIWRGPKTLPGIGAAARARRQGGTQGGVQDPRAATTPPPDDRPSLSVVAAIRAAEAMTDDLAALLERPGPGPHRTTIVDRRRPDRDAGRPAAPPRRLLFVGLNPSPVSVEAGHYFQGRLGRLVLGAG